MGHRAGWLALGAGLAGGADVILIPEIPYDVESVAEAIRRRSRSGTNFSIVAVAEGARSVEDAAPLRVRGGAAGRDEGPDRAAPRSRPSWLRSTAARREHAPPGVGSSRT